MVPALPQHTPESTNDSRSSFAIDRFAKTLYPYRVLLLLLTVVTSSVLLFLEIPFNEHHIHALSQKLAFGNHSPFLTIESWTVDQRQLAQLDLLVDDLFVFIYGLTLLTWCSLFAHKSLFVVDNDGSELNTPTARWMKWVGTKLALFVLVGMAADLIENTIMNTWLYSHMDSIPAWLPWIWKVLMVIKFLPIVAAVWYILLHPLGIFYSFIELWPGQKDAFISKRDDLQTRAKSQQGYMAEVKEETVRKKAASFTNVDLPGSSSTIKKSVSDSDKPNEPSDSANDQGGPTGPNTPNGNDPTNPGRPNGARQRFGWLLTFWNSLLGIQFLAYLLVFMSVVINLDQFDEIFFLWLSSSSSLRIIGTISCLLLTLVCLSAMLYVTSKILLYLRPTKGVGPPNQSAAQAATTLNTHSAEFSFVQFLPLVFVALPFVITILAFITSYSDLPPIEHDEPSHIFQFVLLVAVLLLSGLITVYQFYKRHKPDEETEMLLFVSTTPTQDYALLVRLIPGSMLFGQGLLNVLLLIFIPSMGLAAAQWIGLHAVLLLWLCVVAYLGTLLIQFNKLPLYPLILGLALYTLIASMFNDNSAIRQTPDTASIVDKRPTFTHYYDLWYNQRKSQDTTDKTEIPVVIIATEGGGIRAAAWTTACLHQLDSLIPGFTRYVFGISGVSGGGVGAATYIALQRINAPKTDSLPPLVSQQAQNVVSSDLIAPTVASMLFRGGVHNFSPTPILWLDRNRWLEDSWEKATFAHMRHHKDSVRLVLEKSFLQYCNSPSDSTRFPLLFLNSSVAETGQKAILSPLNLENSPVPPTNHQPSNSHFYDVVDLFAVTKADIPFKTATFLCARFPFVTSGGRAEGQLPNMKPSYDPSFHLIDGGYVENTGIMTGVQIIRRLQQISDSAHYKVHYYLLSLQNGQATDNVASKSTFRFVSEPLMGFLNAAGRQGFALDQLVAYTLKKHPNDPNDQLNELEFSYINLSLDRSKGHQYPLGWSLSPTAASSLNEAAKNQLSSMLTSNPLASLKNYINRNSGVSPNGSPKR